MLKFRKVPSNRCAFKKSHFFLSYFSRRLFMLLEYVCLIYEQFYIPYLKHRTVEVFPMLAKWEALSAAYNPELCYCMVNKWFTKWISEISKNSRMSKNSIYSGDSNYRKYNNLMAVLVAMKLSLSYIIIRHAWRQHPHFVGESMSSSHNAFDYNK